jgi:hypothetical protein
MYTSLRRLAPLFLLVGSCLAVSTLSAAEPPPMGKDDPSEDHGKIDLAKLRQGLPAAEVRRLLGPPKHVSRQILYGRYLEQWTYDSPNSVRVEFDWLKGQEKQVQSVQPITTGPR